MIEDKRVVAWTPFGRQVTVSILAEYLKRDHARGLIDEWWLCLNTDPGQDADLAYAVELAATYDWVKLKARPADCVELRPKQRNTGYFYRYMIDPDTIYLRFDDDIVYVHDAAVERLVRAKTQQPDATACFAFIWNNAICSFFAQQCGVIPKEWGDVQPYCMDSVGWANGEFAVRIHRLLLEHIQAGTVAELFLYQDFSVRLGEQFSVSCFASAGADYAALPDGPGVLVPDEEESWHTIHRPRALGQPNVIIGNALVSHYTFYPQRGVVSPTDVLDRYRALAEALNVAAPAAA